MEEKLVNDLTDSTQLISAKSALNIISEIEILIDVIATRLVECRKLRLDEITSDEIKILERKLFKHFIQQLDAKQRVHPKDFLSDLHQYPSLPNLLTLAGVSPCLANAMKRQRYSVEHLMNLTDNKLDYTVKDLGGNTNDTDKLFSALSILRKSSSESTSDFSRNGSESSGSTGSDAFGPPGRINFDFPNVTEQKPRRQHSTEIPSTSSSMTPPSPTCGSQSPVDSDSPFGNARSQGTSQISLCITPSTPSYFSTAPSTPITPGTPRKTSQQLLHPGSHEFPFSSKNISRDRFPSTGAKTTLSTSAAKLKASKSTEFNIGSPRENLALGYGNMSGSSQSLASTASHSSPSITKQSKGHKKRNKRPNLTVDTDKLDFISLSRSTARRGSSTISPEGLDSSSPFSIRPPSSPLTPDSLGSSHQSLPGTPKTPKSNFKAMKKIFKKIGIKRDRKIKRNQSSEYLADSADQLPPVQRKRSGTMPSPNSKLMIAPNCTLPASHPTSVCSTPLASPGMKPSFSNDEFDSSSRPTSLVDTDKTLVPDDLAEDLKVVKFEYPEGERRGSTSSYPDDPSSSLSRHGSLMQSEEWDIHYDDLKIIEKIGSGRVGTVHRGYWHADVAIRVIDINIDDEEKLKAFKQEIGVFKKTRHENLELFMGSCMNPPNLAIVTGFCRGRSLFNSIRENRLQTKDNHMKIIAQHIVQGMGYLHSKGIVHKDLKSKNIFVDGKRVVITGFGLVGLHAVAYDSTRKLRGYLKVPDGWLCYLAPELIRSLRVPLSDNDDIISSLPYTNMTDVFAFGTVWFELLAGSWPNQGLHPERIIWQVGSDTKYGLTQLQTNKESDIVAQCWSFDPLKRPDFSNKSTGIMGYLDKLQTQMQRSLSSHPRRAPNRGMPLERMYEGSHLRHSPLSTLHDLAE